MPTALDRRVAYYGEHLSENIARTPDGYLICKNAVIGRTGNQTYRVGEIADPEGLLPDDLRDDDEIQLWRDPKEVFAASTIASFEGKTFTLTHPDKLLNPENDHEHNQGHVQNVHKGSESLESGDWPLLADIIVKGEDAIRAIESGERELSCGYVYRLAREGDRWDQRDILGNHVALVQRGRAGEEARINDSLPSVRKETFVKNEKSTWVKHLLGMGMQLFAKDAKPDELVDANSEVAAALKTLETPPEQVLTIANDKTDKKETKENYVFVGKTADGTKIFKLATSAADAEPEEEKKAAMDRRKSLHDALDRMLDGKGQDDDDDLKKFQKQVDEYLGGKAADDDDDEHPEGCRCAECMKGRDTKTEKEAIEADDEEEEEKEKGEDDAEIVRPEPVLSKEQEVKNPIGDAAFAKAIAQSNMGVLKMLRPFVARSNDQKLIKAFDTMYKGLKNIVKGAAAGTDSSYTNFVKATKTLNKEVGSDSNFKPRESEAEKLANETNDIYKKAGDAQRKAYARPH